MTLASTTPPSSAHHHPSSGSGASASTSTSGRTQVSRHGRHRVDLRIASAPHLREAQALLERIKRVNKNGKLRVDLIHLEHDLMSADRRGLNPQQKEILKTKVNKTKTAIQDIGLKPSDGPLYANLKKNEKHFQGILTSMKKGRVV